MFIRDDRSEKTIATAQANPGKRSIRVEVSGHASHSGRAEYNKKLSDKRAYKIQKQLLGVSAGIAKKMVAVGRGFEENIVGTGTDDSRDAIDRRVEFRVVDCAKL